MTAESSHSLVKALRAVPDFAAIDEDVLLRIVGASANLFYPEGARVFSQGDPSEALYVVLEGRVRISEGDREVDEIAAGHSFGELSLMLETHHNRTAEALEDSEILVLPELSFKTLLADNPDLEASFKERIEAQSP